MMAPNIIRLSYLSPCIHRSQLARATEHSGPKVDTGGPCLTRVSHAPGVAPDAYNCQPLPAHLSLPITFLLSLLHVYPPPGQPIHSLAHANAAVSSRQDGLTERDLVIFAQLRVGHADSIHKHLAFSRRRNSLSTPPEPSTHPPKWPQYVSPIDPDRYQVED